MLFPVNGLQLELGQGLGQTDQLVYDALSWLQQTGQLRLLRDRPAGVLHYLGLHLLDLLRCQLGLLLDGPSLLTPPLHIVLVPGVTLNHQSQHPLDLLLLPSPYQDSVQLVSHEMEI